MRLILLAALLTLCACTPPRYGVICRVVGDSQMACLATPLSPEK